MGFLLGSEYRSDKQRQIWLYGGREVDDVVSFPNYGLADSGLDAVIEGRVAYVGDRILVKGGKTEETQIRRIMEDLANRKTAVIELAVVDVAERDFERFNSWLDTLNASVGYTAKSVVGVETGGLGNALTQSFRSSGPVWDLDISGILSLLELFRGGRVQLREQIQVLSGGTATFSTGQVVETPLIVREPETGIDLVNSIERRTIGLDLTIGATYAEGDWYIDINFNDSSVQSSGEVTTGLRTVKLIPENVRGTFQLASYTRESETTEKRGVPWLAKVPGINKLTRKDLVTKEKRSIMIFGRMLSQ
jgi:type II secretory pathway component GspD/PulD (secretin)